MQVFLFLLICLNNLSKQRNGTIRFKERKKRINVIKIILNMPLK